MVKVSSTHLNQSEGQNLLFINHFSSVAHEDVSQNGARLQNSRFRKARSAVSVILEREAREPHTPAGRVRRENVCRLFISLRAGSLVWVGYRGQGSWREEWGEESAHLILLAGFAGSRFLVAPTQTSEPARRLAFHTTNSP